MLSCVVTSAADTCKDTRPSSSTLQMQHIAQNRACTAFLRASTGAHLCSLRLQQQAKGNRRACPAHGRHKCISCQGWQRVRKSCEQCFRLGRIPRPHARPTHPPLGCQRSQRHILARYALTRLPMCQGGSTTISRQPGQRLISRTRTLGAGAGTRSSAGEGAGATSSRDGDTGGSMGGRALRDLPWLSASCGAAGGSCTPPGSGAGCLGAERGPGHGLSRLSPGGPPQGLVRSDRPDVSACAGPPSTDSTAVIALLMSPATPPQLLVWTWSDVERRRILQGVHR